MYRIYLYTYIYKTYENLSDDEAIRFAIQDVSFNIPAGQFVALVGGSGCGRGSQMAILHGPGSEKSGDQLKNSLQLTII